jgi:hypothetical protein
MGLSYKEVEGRVSALADRPTYDREFIFDLLLAYGRSPSNVSRLRSDSASSLNVASDPATELAQKNVLYLREFTEISEGELIAEIERLSVDPAVVRFSTRFVIVTDYRLMLAKDIKTGQTLITEIGKIPEHFTFFLPWAGMEKTQYAAESHADVAAAERMAKLFDELIKQNPETTQSIQGRHSLNTFFTRILFCFFAEDTGIFQEGQFTVAIESLTQPDGSDLKDFLEDLFSALDTEDDAGKPQYLAAFPYVNGRLFASKSHLTVPVFNKKARDILVESGKLQWSQINPDIFGSMFQAVVTPDQRANLGQHYTSVPNILKTIEPLFLDALKEEFSAGFEKPKKLEALLDRIGQIRVFDPACGSGNFLVIAYKELRKLEHAVLERLTEISSKHQVLYAESKIDIGNFFGIELDDFAAEVAVLSLWIAKHQMNQEFKQKFRIDIPLIPLKETGRVVQGNAARLDWDTVCPNTGLTEIYLIGNPPYVGSSMQSAEQKEDLKVAYGQRAYSRNLDYVSAWFIKGADYIRATKAEIAFVATNSVAQGDHAGLLFPQIFGMGIEIGYAHTSFKWQNNATQNAGVSVVVIGLRNTSARAKYLITDGIRVRARNVNGYLADGPSVVLARRSKPVSSQLPRMTRGSQPSDDGWLNFDSAEKAKILAAVPASETWIKRYMGGAEFISGGERYCLWLEDSDVVEAQANPEIKKRLSKVAAFRADRNDQATRDFAAKPWRFKQSAYKPTVAILVPSTTSETRNYIPIGYVDANTVISNAAYAVYDAEPWVFAILTSRMHMVWVRAVAGRLETRYRYSNTIVYNNFPVPKLTDAKKNQLADLAFKVLDAREYHAELTLANLYDAPQMPGNLQLAHEELDEQVDELYSGTVFANDEERLSVLFQIYSSLAETEMES